jgi:hypothetical protein
VQVLELTDETGDERLRALALLMLGASTPYETARDEAEAALVESVALSRKLGFAIGLDMALAQLVIIRMRDGQIDEAIAMHEECLEIGRRLRSKPMTAFALVQLAFDHLFKGELETTRRHLVGCANVCRDLEREGNRETSAYCLEGFALVANAQGKPELAARLGAAAEAIRDVISAPVWALFGSAKGQFVEILRQELGDEPYEAAVAAGREMSTEDALGMGVGETA